MKNKFIVLFTILLFANTSFGISSNHYSLFGRWHHRPKVALVLGGGGARGFAELGVLSVLEQKHIPIDLIVGTSVGSIVGSLYADDPNAADVDHLLLNTKKSDLLRFSFANPLQGPLSDNAVQNFFYSKLKAQEFNDLKIKFIAVATNLVNGQTVPISEGLIAPAVNASSALPPFFKPVTIGNQELIDGGASDPVPVDIAHNYHPRIIIAVDISEDLPNAVPSNMIGILHRTSLIRAETTAKLSEVDANVVISPEVGQTGVFDDSKKLQLFQAGEKAAQDALPQICALMKEKYIHSSC